VSSPPPGRRPWAIPLSSALLYLAVAAAFPWSEPGLHYDEALVVRDAVQMLATPAEPTFAHEWHSWIPAGGRRLPIMDLPYLGPVKGYLMLLPFAVLGTGAGVVRGFAVLLAAAGIWAISRTLQREISSGVAAAAGALIAVHPAILDQTVYDNNVVAVWIATLGLVGLAFSGFLRARSARAACLLGMAAGLAVWGRLNFLWLLAAIAISLLACVPGAWSEIREHGLVASLGFGAGAAPVLLYEAITRGGTLRFMESASQGRLPLLGRVFVRLPLLAETLLSDGEHRAIWAGPRVPPAEIVFAAALAVTGVAMALFLPKAVRETHGDAAWRRSSALACVLFALAMLTSRLRVVEHHLVTAVPVAAVAAVLGFRRFALGYPPARALLAAAGIPFAALCLSWDVRAIAGIRRTGGVGAWSDAIEEVSATLASRAPGAAARVLTWGLANNVFVLSGGKAAPTEVFWGATESMAPGHRPWRDMVDGGGFFLIGLVPSPAKAGFRAALTASGASFRRWTFRQRGGAVYAELFQVSPRPAHAGALRESARD